jgi:hypothetical protein
VCAFFSSVISVIASVSVGSYSRDHNHNRCELDSHADTCVAGANTILVATDGRTVNVYSFAADKTPSITIATVATLWEAPDGEKYVLIIHEALYFGDRLPSTLLTPNQLRNNGLVVNDVPRQFDATSSFSIFDPMSGVRIPLEFFGQSAGFKSHKPTRQDWNACTKKVLTSDQPWKPNSSALADAERSVPRPPITAPTPIVVPRSMAAQHSYVDVNQWQVSAVTTIHEPMITHGDRTGNIYGDFDSDLYERILATVNVAADDEDGNGGTGHADPDVYSAESREICSIYREICLADTGERRSIITPEILAQRWKIGLNAAKATLLATTQSGIRNVFAPGERKVRQLLDHLKYPHLRQTMYSDTMFAPKIVAVGGHTAAQIYTNGAGYDFFFPMKQKADAPSTLQSLAEIAGVPRVMVTDGEGTLRGKDWLKVRRLCQGTFWEQRRV